MFIVVKVYDEFYGYEFDDIEDEYDNINSFLVGDDIVVIGNDIDDIAELLNIDPKVIDIVD
jgi:hypothetical protein